MSPKDEVLLELQRGISKNCIDWENKRVKTILQRLKQEGIKLTLENIPTIIEETSFRVRSKKYPDECPDLYKKGISCHPRVKDLNCFLCNCPQYNAHYIDNNLIGKCNANSKHGKYASSKNGTGISIWDCSNCTAYHSPKAVEIYLRNNMERLQEISASL